MSASTGVNAYLASVTHALVSRNAVDTESMLRPIRALRRYWARDLASQTLCTVSISYEILLREEMQHVKTLLGVIMDIMNLKAGN